MLKKALILAVVMTTCILAQSGTTGSLSWSISGETLTISGSGAMPDYTIECVTPYNDDFDCSAGRRVNTVPWNMYRNDFTEVIISNSVTSIGDKAFQSFDRLTSVTIPNSVTDIGHYAFAFFGFNLRQIINYAKIPQDVKVTAFSEYYYSYDDNIPTKANITLYVPAESVEKYRAAPIWRDFNIKAMLTEEEQRVQDSIATEQLKMQDAIRTEAQSARANAATERAGLAVVTTTRRECVSMLEARSYSEITIKTETGNHTFRRNSRQIIDSETIAKINSDSKFSIKIVRVGGVPNSEAAIYYNNEMLFGIPGVVNNRNPEFTIANGYVWKVYANTRTICDLVVNGIIEFK